MLKIASLLLTILLVVVAAAAGQNAAPPITLDEILALNLKAHGGAEKVNAVKTLRLSGTLEFAPGSDGAIMLAIKRPEDVRQEFTLQGMTQYQGFDGKIGWGTDPFNGKKEAEPLGEDDLKDLQESADLGFPLMSYKDKGFKVEYVGLEPVEGSDAYKVKVTLNNGDVIFYYLDTDYFLEIREEVKRSVRGSEREIDTSIGNYKQVDGLAIPMYEETGTKGNPNTQKITYDKVEINPPGLDDAKFQMPEKKPASNPANNAEKKGANHE